MKCYLCNKPIKAKGTWTQGNNAEPLVKNGRCCDRCNKTKVIVARLERLMKQAT